MFEISVKSAFSAYIGLNGGLSYVKHWVFGGAGVYGCSLLTASAPL